MNEVDVTVVLPVLNEAGAIRSEIERICACLADSPYSFEVDVYDDASQDGSREILREMAGSGNYPQVRPFYCPIGVGVGTLRRAGTEDARGRVVVWTDADGTYPNERIPELVDILLNPSYDCEQVVGWRTVEAGTLRWLRTPTKALMRRACATAVGHRIPDLNSGLRAFFTETARQYVSLLPRRFGCASTMSVAYLRDGRKVRWVPIDYRRRIGQSKYRCFRDTWKQGWHLWSLLMNEDGLLGSPSLAPPLADTAAVAPAARELTYRSANGPSFR